MAQLTGVYQSVEHAIVEAIHILTPFSEYSDDSVRCKQIFSLVRDSTIYINGQPQTGNHRFTIFSSALSGRRSSVKLFQKVTDPERHGAWWKLKVPYEEALRICHSLILKNPHRRGDIFEWQSNFDIVSAPREEEIRNRFLSFVPLCMVTEELQDSNEEWESKINEIKEKIEVQKQNSTPETLQNLQQLIQLQSTVSELRRNRRRNDFDLNDGHQLQFF
ncbi:hypothetical protein TVAG_115060 [Trichomonas vaginalis G3]|uniref:Uncharacterized protein n=1 Tax=Trichomonas vaginalis (strain ATCC PRA-98 / G3) TaxID=412133 RepID=A2G6K4_TRIV3|nr:hypothetical protein TVAGG3_0866700 [Trichomonas vaginalis G3]EAX87214.1 hypothetical protein TVAG_115060 [Trichomonas vaginalis G3]KAI5501082.1 hypothetical protein TVAGG3_0866700 [Trichomonas vaginalis G3]|eukprot:XP_001300144.1 hypothetical protein [Trichomonas vaginalis G3]